MSIIKPRISFYAEDFGLIKQYLTADEIVEMFSAIQDLCIFGETDYKPKNAKQQYCWSKLKNEFDKDLASYQTAVQNGKKGGRPAKITQTETQNITQTETQNITQTETQNITQTETQNITQTESSLTLDTCHLTQDITTCSDKSSQVVVKTQPHFDLTPLNVVFERFGLPKVQKMTDDRRRKLKLRCEETGGYGEFIGQVEAALANSSFLRGDNRQGWRAGIDFFLQRSSWQKVLEGVYADKKTQNEDDFYKKLEALG